MSESVQSDIKLSFAFILFFSDFCPLDWSWILVKETLHAISKMIFNTYKCSILSVVSLSELNCRGLPAVYKRSTVRIMPCGRPRRSSVDPLTYKKNQLSSETICAWYNVMYIFF